MDYIEECKAKGFDNMQIHEVEEGFRHGLNGDQVDLYADIDFDHLQMQEIRLGLQDGLVHWKKSEKQKRLIKILRLQRQL
ncbi:MAG: hypothetical protein GX478_10165 [Erysipelotrichaceae bacterium]|jgi:hypothetical protein|nr:hypothetical protein [Erysipelotrichaceae bacterium]